MQENLLKFNEPNINEEAKLKVLKELIELDLPFIGHNLVSPKEKKDLFKITPSYVGEKLIKKAKNINEEILESTFYREDIDIMIWYELNPKKDEESNYSIYINSLYTDDRESYNLRDYLKYIEFLYNKANETEKVKKFINSKKRSLRKEIKTYKQKLESLNKIIYSNEVEESVKVLEADFKEIKDSLEIKLKTSELYLSNTLKKIHKYNIQKREINKIYNVVSKFKQEDMIHNTKQ